MKVNEFISKAEIALGNAFPDYVIRLFPDPDDDTTFFAYTFGVPDGAEHEAKCAVRAFIGRHLDSSVWDIIPSIKNLSVTREYYPQYLCPNSARPVSNAVIFELVQDSRHVRKYFDDLGDDDFRDTDFDEFLAEPVTCTMPIHRENHEGQFDIAA